MRHGAEGAPVSCRPPGSDGCAPWGPCASPAPAVASPVISSSLSLAPSAPGFWSCISGAAARVSRVPRFRRAGGGCLCPGCRECQGVARVTVGMVVSTPAQRCLQLGCLLPRHLAGGREGCRGGGGGLPFLLALFLFVSSAPYLLQCPLSSLRFHTKDWRRLEGLGGLFKPPFRKDLVSLLTKRFHREDLFNLLSALHFWDEYEDRGDTSRGHRRNRVLISINMYMMVLHGELQEIRE